MTRASVLIPTHDAVGTLDLSVRSALQQTERDLEVVLLGDGVVDEVRALAHELEAEDARVRFLDLPKGEHHGELQRDRVIREELRSPVVCYLCDDDLLLPEHVEDLLGLLEGADLVNSMNGFFAVDGSFTPHFSDLGTDEHRAWIMHERRNSVSVTGTAHTVAAYRRLAVGWRPPPPGRWTDHLVWQQLLALPGLRTATSHRVTAIQLPSHLEGRAGWTQAQRRTELERWWERIGEPAGRRILDDLVRQGLNHAGALLQSALSGCEDRSRALETELEVVRRAAVDEAAGLRAQIAHVESAHRDVARRLALIEGSRVWRARSRVVRGPLRRLVRGAARSADPGSTS